MKKEKQSDTISTFLGQGTSIDGTLEFQGTIRLDGNVKGQITSQGGTLIIGDKAVIQAQVQVETVIIRGEVNGSVEAKKRIEAYPPARIVGDIQAPVISIESGVVFNGNCIMQSRSISKSESG
ncbi:MAG: polymer-forming cytoskeletal protein [Deltaproteobacteria bacterium]|nr:polymer-forming cytoskeletal protein [Deltaproteobacteria bacterium]MBW2176517.1 polymer-forming cytoskeletal protein [Deltaproteobacteria bacterium]MBW2296738.1 polymer-forming cytoskeletal protein [Deltaproteobacteria bacterium]MBW2612466.1 polymer-forming cytoskeletal protein [Deltaproteobacteria bacterium]MBW2676598.1 polymer-forming cytoskeletal protein [Deltaproteobacteria bacterium]